MAQPALRLIQGDDEPKKEVQDDVPDMDTALRQMAEAQRNCPSNVDIAKAMKAIRYSWKNQEVWMRSGYITVEEALGYDK